jgi:hypothetical protein
MMSVMKRLIDSANSGIMHIGGGCSSSSKTKFPIKISYTSFTGFLYEECCLLRLDAMQPGSSLIFQRNVLHPSSGLKGISRKLPTCLAYSSALKMEAVRSSQTEVSSYQVTRHHVAQNNTVLQNSNVTLVPFLLFILLF